MMIKNSKNKNSYFGKVAVLLGGNSAEREVSLRSGEAILKGLKKQSVDAHGIDTAHDAIKQIQQGHFDRVFIALHGKGGEDGVIQGALETLEIPYTGSSVTGSAIGMDKWRSKQIWQSLALPVIPAESIKADASFSTETATRIFEKLGSTLMVKPSTEGSSIGMTKAETVEQLIAGFKVAAKFDGNVLIEQWIEGKEYSVSILNGKALPAIYIKPAREFYDYDAKYTESGTQYFCPTDLSKDEEQYLADMSLEAFESIDCSGWGRVDFIRDEDSGNFYLLEVNTVPGMTKSSLVPIAARASGLSFSSLVVEILKTSLINRKSDGEQANG